MRTRFRPAKVLGELRQNILAKWHEARERKRIQRADRMKHALIVLQSMRSLNFENGKRRA